MSNEKNIYQNSSTNTHIGIMGSAAAMVGLSLYLTVHYFQVKFPSKLNEGSLCDISAFFNCDAATHSALSNIGGVPISAFGLMIGIMLFIGYFFAPKKMEGTTYYVLALNLVGCLALFVYSLIVLGSLCPFCTLYYIVSALAFYLFHKFGHIRTFAWQSGLAYATLAAIIFGLFSYNIQSRLGQNEALAQDLMNQYKNLPKLGEPETPSPFRLASASEEFSDAPLKITVFADFQCPACQQLSNITHEIEKRYRGDINIQYIFYPLDISCNSAIQRPIMQHSCQAAYLATCLKEDFLQVHDDIYKNQSNLSSKWIQDYAKKRGVEECLKDPATKEKVVDVIELSRPFNITSTPTMLINGAKIAGVIPPNQLFLLLDGLLAQEKN